MSSSVTAGNGSEPPSSGVTTVPVLVFLDGFALSSWLVRVLALFRCVFSFQPSEPNEPLRISASDGAFDAVLPVAAHMPGGGLASINFRLAVRILFEAVEAFVDVLCRRVLEGESGGGVVAFELASRIPAGCGKGTGVEIEFGGAMFAGGSPAGASARLLCEWWWPIPSLRVGQALMTAGPSWQSSWRCYSALAATLLFEKGINYPAGSVIIARKEPAWASRRRDHMFGGCRLLMHE
jgi:pimeloyl-ACP methyl ester carboxylesterase